MAAGSPVPDQARDRAHANYEAWVDVLDRLQRDIDAIERLLESPEPPAGPTEPEPWEPPAIDGPVPDALLGRALALHRRQATAKAALAEALARAQVRQQQASRSPRPAVNGSGAPSAYFDVSA